VIPRGLVDGRRARGNPLDRRGAPDAILAFAVMALMGIGAVMVLSASAIPDFIKQADPFATALPQAVWTLAGLALLTVTARVDWRLVRRLAPLLYAVVVVLLVLVLIPGVGIEAGGSSRWLRLAPGLPTIHPAEIAKIATVLAIAALVDTGRARVRTVQGSLTVAGVIALPLLLVLAEPDLGTASILAVGGLAAYFVAGAPFRFLVPAVALGVLAAAVALSLNDYQAARITAWLDPWSDPQGAGFHTIQGFIGIARGGLTGVGLGAGEQAASLYLPNAQNDYIFAVIAEETGLAGSLLVSGLFLAVVLRGLVIASRAPSRFASIAAAGITAAIGFQAFANIGVVTGLFPVTGVPLPFVSAGGSSLLVLSVAAGILLAISREQGDGRVPLASIAVAAARRAPVKAQILRGR
jgi:cell division protein FtsW